MGLFKQLVPAELKFSPATPGVNWTRINTLVHGPGASDWNRANGQGDGNSAVFACLTTLAMSYPEPPLTVFRLDRQGKQTPLPDSPLQTLLDNPTPNSELTLDEILWWTAWARAVDGNAYWMKVRAGDKLTGNVVELWPISPKVMTPISRGDDWLTAYRWQYAPNQYEDVPPENVVHFRQGIDDQDHRKGMSPLKRLLREIATDAEATHFSDALLRNYAVPGLVVVPAGGTIITEEQADLISTKMRRKFGNDERGNVAVMSREASIEQFGFSPKDLDLQALHRLPEERISAVLGVPAIVAGLGAGLDRATYSNFREAREMFTERTLVPMWRADARKIAISLLVDFDSTGSLGIEFDITNVRALQEDEDKKYARLNIGVQGQRPWITVNEARTDVGLPPIEGGDELTPPEPEPPPQLEDQESGDEEDVEDMEGEKRLPFGWIGSAIPNGVASIKAMLLQLDPDDDEAEQRARMTVERKSERRIARALAKQQDRVVDSLEGVDAQGFLRWANLDLEEALKRTREEFDLYDEIHRALLQSADLGVSVAVRQFEQIGFGFDWTLANERARNWARRYTGQLVTGIDATTRERTRAAVAVWIDNGEPLELLIEDLTPIFGRSRASLIASTEVTRAYAEANRIAYQESGVVDEVEWRTSQDERVCPVCGPLSEQRSSVRNPRFGNVGIPPAHPRCRCWLVPVVPEPEDVAQ